MRKKFSKLAEHPEQDRYLKCKRQHNNRHPAFSRKSLLLSGVAFSSVKHLPVDCSHRALIFRAPTVEV